MIGICMRYGSNPNYNTLKNNGITDIYFQFGGPTLRSTEETRITNALNNAKDAGLNFWLWFAPFDHIGQNSSQYVDGEWKTNRLNVLTDLVNTFEVDGIVFDDFLPYNSTLTNTIKNGLNNWLIDAKTILSNGLNPNTKLGAFTSVNGQTNVESGGDHTYFCTNLDYDFPMTYKYLRNQDSRWILEETRRIRKLNETVNGAKVLPVLQNYIGDFDIPLKHKVT